MRITESQIKSIIRNEVRKGMRINEAGSPIGALERLNAAFAEFMDAGGTTDDLLDNAQGFVEEWESNDLLHI